MDSGEEIPALNEGWTFLGAKLFEWMAGFFVGMMLSELVFKGSVAQNMPLLLGSIVGSAMGIASIRSRYPDEERGMRNSFMVLLGFTPPGIPTPAPLQPYWSAAPNRSLEPKREFIELELDKLFFGTTSQEEADPD